MSKTKKRLIIDSGQFEKIDNRLFEIANNILTEQDIETRSYYWEERLIVYQGWDDWNYEKSFLPQDFDEYDQVKKEVKEKVWIEKKEGDKNKPGYPRYPRTQREVAERQGEVKEDDGAFELDHENPNTGSQWNEFDVKIGKDTLRRKLFRYNCYLLRDHNHIKQFVFQNEHQNDFSRPDIVIFFRGLLYWVTDYDVIDSRMLYVHVICKRDVTWIYHKQIMSRPGTANIVRSQLTKYRPARKDPHDKNSEVLKNEKGGVIIDYKNPFPDHCFSFCSDLRCEKISSPIAEIETFGSSHSGRSVDAEWQPEFGVVFADPATFGLRGGADDVEIKGANNKTMAKFPTSMKFQEYKGESMGIFPMILFLIDGSHFDKVKRNIGDGKKGNTVYTSIPSTKGDLAGKPKESGEHITSYATAFTAWLPNIFNEQPHLIYHSTTQFYFLRKLVTTVELKRLKITYKGAKNWESAFGSDIKKGEIHCIKYRIRIMSSAVGVTYHFESGDIFFRWELQVQQLIQAKAMWDTLIRSWALNVSNFLSGLGLPTDTIWGNMVHETTKKYIDEVQKAFRKKLKEKAAKEAKKFGKKLRSHLWAEGKFLGIGGGGSIAIVEEGFDILVRGVENLFDIDPEREVSSLDVNQTIIKKDTLKGQLGLYDSKEMPSEEQNTARMKSSTETTGRLLGGDTTELDRDFGSMKQTKSFDAEREQSETVHKSIKKTTNKGTEQMSLGKMNSPAHYYVNTIKMKYDVYEFFNRSIANPFEIRFDYSDQLYNSLENCNHSSPAQSFDRIAFITNCKIPARF